MFAQLVTELSKLSLAGVLEAELEGHAGDVVVQRLHVGIGSEELQALAI